jgi:hypothetical protein
MLFALPAFSVSPPTQDHRGTIADHSFSMVDPDAGIAAVETDGEDAFRGSGAVAAPHRSVDAGDRDVIADTRFERHRIAWERRPRDGAVCGGLDATQLSGAGIGIAERDEAVGRAPRRANRDRIPWARAFVSAFLEGPTRMWEVGDARRFHATFDAAHEAVRAIRSGEVDAPTLGGLTPEPSAPAVASEAEEPEERHDRNAHRGSPGLHLTS